MPYFYTTRAYATVADQPSINLDPSQVPFAVTVYAKVAGTVSFKMQYSLDPMTVADADATWIDSSEIPAATAVSISAKLTSPYARIRFVTATASAGNTVTVQVLQGMAR